MRDPIDFATRLLVAVGSGIVVLAVATGNPDWMHAGVELGLVPFWVLAPPAAAIIVVFLWIRNQR